MVDVVNRPASTVVASRWVAACMLLVGAAIHVVAIAPHAEHWPAAGAFFAVLAVAQTAAAVLLVTQLTNRGAVAAALISIGTVVLWLVTRTVGLPFGPGAGVAEQVTTGDLVSTASSLLTLMALVPMIGKPAPASLRPTGRFATGFTILAPLVLAGTLAVAMPSVEQHEHDHGASTVSVPAAQGTVHVGHTHDH